MVFETHLSDALADEIAAVVSEQPLPWPSTSSIDATFVRALLRRLYLLSFHPPEMLAVCGVRSANLLSVAREARELLARQPNVVEVLTPARGRTHVVGDLHGHVHDLCRVLDLAGMPDAQNVLVFNGDFVDRGSWGVECLLVLLTLKVWQPDRVYLIRGNHETLGCVVRYGFQEETRRKYNDKAFAAFLSVFRELPLAGLVKLAGSGEAGSAEPVSTPSRQKGRTAQKRGGKLAVEQPIPGERRILVLHGGLFRKWNDRGQVDGATIESLENLSHANRRVEDPEDSAVEDVLWSDPQVDKNDVSVNHIRGAGILYGPGTLEKFLTSNHLSGLIRGHEGPDMREMRPSMQSMDKGHSWDMEFGSGKFLLTVFSACDYPMDKPRGNQGAFATIRGRDDAEGRKSVGSSILPDVTCYEKVARPAPGEFVLFYDSSAPDQPATPRHS